MKNLDGKISPKVVEILLEQGIERLNPLQNQAIKKDLLKLNSSFVISAPTASGKTLLAELVMLKSILEQNGKAVYIVPLRALANDKYQDFKKKYEKLGIKIGISTGDYDSSDPWLKNYDIIIVTSEKMDSLIRHKAEWIRDLTVVIADECHLLTFPDRGPTLEITLTRLKRINPKLIFLLLSATIKNAEELAAWMDAKLIESKYRPVKLYEGISYSDKILFYTKPGYKLEERGTPVIRLARDTLKKGKQALIFVSTRRYAESAAKRISDGIAKHLAPKRKEELKKISEKIHKALEHPTKQCEKLAEFIRNGCAFHHAGLAGKQRVVIENGFRDQIIPFIVATPTLSFGVDLPAYRVVIRDLKRFHGGYGMEYISTLEEKQMSGRAGRPRYDKEGEAILVAKSQGEIDELEERYILGEPEEITSKLSAEPILRMHVLSMISTEISDWKGLLSFFSQTFWGFQYGDIESLAVKIDHVLERLRKYGFVVKRGTRLEATRLGKRVSELYIDPETAWKIISFLRRGLRSDLAYLAMISDTYEMLPLPGVKAKEKEEIDLKLDLHEEELDIPEEYGFDYYDFLRVFKLALVFNEWINETGEDRILEKYNMLPGILFSKLQVAEWLLYASSELARILGQREEGKRANRLRMRIKYGVKEELIELVKLKGIGRVRSRMLYKAGFKKTRDLRKAREEEIARIVGVKVARSVKEQL